METRTIEELCSLIAQVSRVGAPGGGTLVFVRTDQQEKVRKLAIELAKSISQDEPLPIYVVGSIQGSHDWPFSRIKRGPRLRLMPNGQMVTESGLFFPQDRAIILLVEYFDCLEPHDQRAYTHLVDGEGGEYALHKGSILIGVLISSNPGQLEAGSANRGFHFDLA